VAEQDDELSDLGVGQAALGAQAWIGAVVAWLVPSGFEAFLRRPAERGHQAGPWD
jgi:hypothetical protein